MRLKLGFCLSLVFAVSCKSAEQDSSSSEINAAASVIPATARVACAQADDVWNNKIANSQYTGALPALYSPGPIAVSDLGNPLYTRQTFQDGEEIRQGLLGRRAKVIHSVGVVARVKFVSVEGNPGRYSGIFAEGAHCGLARLSLAVKPSNSLIPLMSNKYTPGMALKFYVGGKPSVNMHVMHSLDGEDSTNFFSVPFANVLPRPNHAKAIAGAEAFKMSMIAMGAEDSFPGHLTVEHVASVVESGNEVTPVKSPGKVTFRPTAAAQGIFNAGNLDMDSRTVLTRFPTGGTLYDVYATDSIDYSAPQGVLIGRLVTTSPFVASEYADKILHFQHHTKLRGSH